MRRNNDRRRNLSTELSGRMCKTLSTYRCANEGKWEIWGWSGFAWAGIASEALGTH
jgi:hypothetical protein